MIKTLKCLKFAMRDQLSFVDSSFTVMKTNEDVKKNSSFH